MVYKRKTTTEERELIRFLYMEKRYSLREIAGKVGRSAATVMRVLKESNSASRHLRTQANVTYKRRGRPRKLSSREERLLIRALHKLRRTEGNFTVKRLMNETNILVSNASVRTVARFLNSQGYFYLQARKKGLLTNNDKNLRIAFAKKVRQEYNKELWTQKIAFYLDGVAFAHKTNPLDQARAPTGRIYRKKSEGLNQYCTAKGSKVGSGGKIVKFLVAISYNVGVILCEEYEHMTGNFFASFIGQTFEQMFVESKKGDTRLFIQDNDPSQNSAVAKIALQRVSAQLLKIPPRSPDLNPIENMFKSVSDDLHDSTIEKQLERESFTQFKERVKDTIVRFPVAKINNLIESMDRHIQLILETKGQRLKY